MWVGWVVGLCLNVGYCGGVGPTGSGVTPTGVTSPSTGMGVSPTGDTFIDYSVL
jgi:hypothetical protein